jgi:lipopolysaccharide export LptBFGC system permease protein LptF
LQSYNNLNTSNLALLQLTQLQNSKIHTRARSFVAGGAPSRHSPRRRVAGQQSLRTPRRVAQQVSVVIVVVVVVMTAVVIDRDRGRGRDGAVCVIVVVVVIVIVIIVVIVIVVVVMIVVVMAVV